MTFLWGLLFVLAVLFFWSLNLVGLPGNWLIVLATVLYAWLTSKLDSFGLGFAAVAVVTALAVFGEILELVASAIGVKRYGGSRRSAILALCGSLVGAITGLFVGIPIPVVGPVIAAILFAGFGAFGGAALGELAGGRSFEASWDVGWAAFCGRVVGTLAKTAVGAAMAVVAITIVFI